MVLIKSSELALLTPLVLKTLKQSKFILTDNAVHLSKIIDKFRGVIEEDYEQRQIASTSFIVIPKASFENIAELFEGSKVKQEENSVWELLARLEIEGFRLDRFMPKLVNVLDLTVSKEKMISHVETKIREQIKAIKPTENCTFIVRGRNYIN